ncbi:MAG: hypothetical protein QME68_02490 [Elusimicrobiota bacterium]|nr:hypothetical protein [Elusimicrobiota bacterium]
MFQTLVQVAVYATILGVFITIAAWLNGRRTTKEIREIIQEMNERWNKTLEKISEQIEKIPEKTAILMK